MKDDDSLPTTAPTTNSKKDSSDASVFGRGRYKFWALAAILLLAFWSMFTGTVTLRWSAGNLNHISDDLDFPIHDDLDVLEMEEREKVVKHMWDVYTNSRRSRLPRFWQEAFEAAYEDLTNDDPGVREDAISEIARMSVRNIDLDPPPIKPTISMFNFFSGFTDDSHLLARISHAGEFHTGLVLSVFIYLMYDDFMNQVVKMLRSGTHLLAIYLGCMALGIVSRDLGKSLKQSKKDTAAVTSSGNSH